MNPIMPRLTGKRVEKALIRAGWYLHHSRGSHSYDRHPDHPGKQLLCLSMPGRLSHRRH